MDTIDKSSKRVLTMRPEQIHKIFSSGPFCHFYIQTPGGVFEVNGASVVPSADIKHTGPAYGYFLVFRVLDSNYIEGLGSLLDGKASLEPPLLGCK